MSLPVLLVYINVCMYLFTPVFISQLKLFQSLYSCLCERLNFPKCQWERQFYIKTQTSSQGRWLRHKSKWKHSLVPEMIPGIFLTQHTLISSSLSALYFQAWKAYFSKIWGDYFLLELGVRGMVKQVLVYTVEYRPRENYKSVFFFLIPWKMRSKVFQFLDNCFLILNLYN